MRKVCSNSLSRFCCSYMEHFTCRKGKKSDKKKNAKKKPIYFRVDQEF